VKRDLRHRARAFRLHIPELIHLFETLPAQP